jgi:hypothetical protein
MDDSNVNHYAAILNVIGGVYRDCACMLKYRVATSGLRRTVDIEL